MKYSQLLFLLVITLILGFGVTQIATAADWPYCKVGACLSPGNCSLDKCTCPEESMNHPGQTTTCYAEAHGFCGTYRWCAD